jgi:hypothetical protein
MLNELANMKEAVARCGYTMSTDEIARSLEWTERLFGRGYDLLRLGAAPNCVERKDLRAADVTVIDALGCTAFGLIPSILQLAMSPDTEPRLRKVSVNGALGGWIAPYIAYRLAEERYHTAVFWRPGIPLAPAEPPATLILAASAVGGKVRPMMITPGVPWSEERREKVLVGHVPVELSNGLHDLLGSFANGGTNGLAVAAMPESMEAQFSEFVPLEDVIEEFGLQDLAPNLLNVEPTSRPT